MITNNGKEFVVTSSWDKKIRAWSVNGAELEAVAEQVLPCRVNDLVSIDDSIIIGGLESGALAVWNLGDNSINSLPLHQSPIKKMKVTANFVITADQTGVVQVLDRTANPLFVIQTSTEVTQINVIET